MAEELTIDGQLYKKRGPLAVWLLSIVTLGIYGLVWYYKINDEVRRYLGDDTIRPGIAVLALFPGSLIIVPPFISVYRTGERIDRMEARAGIQRQVEPALGLLLLFLWSLFEVYYQGHLNAVWDSALAAGARPSAPPTPALTSPPSPSLPPEAPADASAPATGPAPTPSPPPSAPAPPAHAPAEPAPTPAPLPAEQTPPSAAPPPPAG